MKITHFEILRVPPCWVWLKIHTDTELVGWGEPYLENHPDIVIAEVQRMESPVIVKTCRMGYDGKGQVRLDDVSQSKGLYDALGRVPLLIEKLVPYHEKLKKRNSYIQDACADPKRGGAEHPGRPIAVTLPIRDHTERLPRQSKRSKI